ncbi:MAG: GrpB family protein [Bacilli bacterium]|nr:GrpB family protein [Bacilli bacterium]
MKISSYQPIWNDQFHSIAKYLQKTLSNCEIKHVGLTAIRGMAACPIIDIHVVIPTINELPLMNDCLQILDYLFIGNTKTIGEYNYQNNNLDFPNHHLSVVIAGEEADFYQTRFQQCCQDDLSLVIQCSNHLLSTYPGEVILSQYYEETRILMETELKNRGIQAMRHQIMWPDFNNSLMNVTSSIQKHYQVKPLSSTLDCVDEALEGKQHVFLILLDGMGIDIMEKNLPLDAYLWKYLRKQITSIYPPTTVAATTAVQTGLLPNETGWIGWHQYFKAIDRDVILFRNEDYYTDEVIPGVDTQVLLPTTPIYQHFKGVQAQTLWPSFRPDGFHTFHDMIDRAIEISHTSEETYTYLYWNEPDASLHELGCQNDDIRSILSNLSDEVERFKEYCGSKSTIIVVADHGLVDVLPIYINRFKDITDLLTTRPSLEGRSTVFFVKDKQTFPQVFRRYFSNYFDLYACETFMATGLLGDHPEKCKPFLGDFIALAKDKYTLCAKVKEECFIATHAGQTRGEMLVPLIIIEKD